MKNLASLLLTISLLFMTPLLAMDNPKQQDPDTVSIAGLKHEHVLIALWNSASGGDNPMGQTLFLAANSKKRPTEEMATQYLQDSSSGGYFCGRKVSAPGGSAFYCRPFNDNHGKGRAQQVIQALRELSLAGPITLEKIFSLYIPVPTELGAEEEAKIKALRKAGNYEEADIAHHYAVRQKEDAQMQALVDGGNFEAAMKMYAARSQRESAEVGGMLVRTLAKDGTSEQKKAAQDFNRGMAIRHMGVNSPQTPPTPPTRDSAPQPSPTTPPIQGRTETPNDFSIETQGVLAKGLRGMFGGPAPKNPAPKGKK